MSEQATATRGRLRERAAEEIRVILARKRMSTAELARRTGIKTSTMSRRMTGEVPFDLDDLEAIAAALGVAIGALLPRDVLSDEGVTVLYPQPAERPMPRPAGRPRNTHGNRPPGQPSGDTRPGTTRTSRVKPRKAA